MSAPRVAEALAQLASFAAEDFAVDDMLRRLGEVAAAVLDIDGAGVMGTDSEVGHRTRFVYASRLSLQPLEDLQQAIQSGPCKQATLSMRTVVCPTAQDLAVWPDFAAAAAVAGVCTVVAAPLISQGRCWGVLDLYWMTDTALTADDVAEIELLAKVAVSYLVIAEDRLQARTAQLQLKARLLHDPLTGLANRELIHELTYHALALAARRGRPVALLFIDLDGFKLINDRRGHRAGDAVLRSVGERLRTAVRASDTVSRLGGDEFLILCEDLPADEQAAEDALCALGERIVKRISEPLSVDDGPPVSVNGSIGIASTSGQPSVADFIHDADLAMYRAKQQHNQPRIAVHRHEACAGDAGRRVLERQLFGALERGEMRVHYQPILDTRTGRIVAVEALLRWMHPNLGLLSAGEFIDLALTNGTIVGTGHWMVQAVLQQLRQWQDTFPDTCPGSVFLNLAPQQLIDPDLAAVIADQLRVNRLPAAAVTLEITETAMTDDRVQPCAVGLHTLGHPLAIDDFGTGYSSLARMIELPVTYLKIDRFVVARLPGDPQACALLQSVQLIAQTMDLAVVSEGVETAEQAEHLTRAGCHLQQGYHHGRPQPADQLAAILECQTHTRPAQPTPDGPVSPALQPLPTTTATSPGLNENNRAAARPGRGM